MLFPDNPRKATITLILTLTVIRFILAAFTGLGVGESYYWRGAQDLQLSYFDQPPLFLWLSYVSLNLLDLTNLGLRLPAVLLSVGTSWLLFLSTRRLFKDDLAGFYAVVLFSLSFVFTIPNAIWFQPDAPLQFFWMLTFYALIGIFFREDPSRPPQLRLFLILGLSMGLTALSKYHAVLLMGSAFLFVVLQKEQRYLLRHPGPYLAVILVLLCLLPVFYWNWQHDWISFTFQGGRAGSASFSLTRMIRSIGGQMIWIGPWIWIPLIVLLIKTGREQTPRNLFLFLTSVLPVGFFTLVALVSRIQYHFHWQAPGYLILFIPLGAYVAEKIRNGDRRYLSGIKWSAWGTGLLSLLLVVHMHTGFWTVLGPGWAGRQFNAPDPTIWGIDFNEISERFESEGWSEQEDLFVVSVKWWQAGKIDWPLRGRLDTFTFSGDPRNNAFLLDPRKHLGHDAILLRYDKGDKSVGKWIEPYFDQIERLEDISIKRAGKTELVIQVFRCVSFRQPEVALPDQPIFRQLIGAPPYGND